MTSDKGFPIRGQSPPAVDQLGRTACTKASATNAAATVDLLLQHGPDINKTIISQTALMRVASYYLQLIRRSTQSQPRPHAHAARTWRQFAPLTEPPASQAIQCYA